MPARFILHVMTTLVLFAVGWWLYMRMGDTASGAIDSTSVAMYWFASLVFMLFSWIFYWFVHRLKTRAWVISLIIAVLIAVAATVILMTIAADNQRKLEEVEMKKESKIKAPDDAKE